MADIVKQVLQIQRYAQRVDAVLAMWGLDHPDGCMLLARQEYVYRVKRRRRLPVLAAVADQRQSHWHQIQSHYMKMEEQPMGVKTTPVKYRALF